MICLNTALDPQLFPWLLLWLWRDCQHLAELGFLHLEPLLPLQILSHLALEIWNLVSYAQLVVQAPPIINGEQLLSDDDDAHLKIYGMHCPLGKPHCFLDASLTNTQKLTNGLTSSCHFNSELCHAFSGPTKTIPTIHSIVWYTHKGLEYG